VSWRLNSRIEEIDRTDCTALLLQLLCQKRRRGKRRRLKYLSRKTLRSVQSSQVKFAALFLLAPCLKVGERPARGSRGSQFCANSGRHKFSDAMFDT
jgi:hypothetical protein